MLFNFIQIISLYLNFFLKKSIVILIEISWDLNPDFLLEDNLVFTRFSWSINFVNAKELLYFNLPFSLLIVDKNM